MAEPGPSAPTAAAEKPQEVAIRDVYGKTLAQLGEERENIVVLDADLSGSTRTVYFAKKFPHRFFNMGVAEQGMMDAAAGLASTGKVVFASSFAIFATGRAWESVRQSIAVPALNVKIVATHAGITVGEDGTSHQMLEDIALMRVLPNMTVVVPSDGPETAAAIRAVAERVGPCYVRLARAKFPVINPDPCPFTLGKARVLRRGRDATVVAAGIMVSMALKAAELLAGEGIEVGVVNLSTIKPIDRETLAEAARESGGIVTAEEHNIYGGLGGAVAEVLMEDCPVPFVRFGMRDRFGVSGEAKALLAHFGLTHVELADAVREVVKKKKR